MAKAKGRYVCNSCGFANYRQRPSAIQAIGVIQNVEDDRYKLGAKLFEQWVVKERKLEE